MIRTDRNYGNIPFKVPLDTNGDQTGTAEATGDYTSTPTSFKLVPGPDETLYVCKIQVVIAALVDPINIFGYGSGAQLDKVIHPLVKKGDETITELAPGGVNSQLVWHLFSDDHDTFVIPSAATLLRYAFDFTKTQPIILKGNEGHYLSFDLNDDFASRTIVHFFFASGLKYKPYTSPNP